MTRPKSTSEPSSTHAASSELCENVLESLAAHEIAPRPWWQFYAWEGMVWGLWILSVVVGAVAVAVVWFVTVNLPYTLYEVTAGSLWLAFWQAVPWVWFIVFVLMAYAAWVNLRRTRRGYRYQALTLVLSSVVLSVLLGVVLQQFGQGYFVDHAVSVLVPAYPSYEQMQLKSWQAPRHGRVVGTPGIIVASTTPATSSRRLQFTDMSGKEWRLVLTSISSRGESLLYATGTPTLRLLGTSTTPTEFHVCGVFRWSFDADPSFAEYKNRRDTARDRFWDTVTRYRRHQVASSSHPCLTVPVIRHTGPPKP